MAASSSSYASIQAGRQLAYVYHKLQGAVKQSLHARSEGKQERDLCCSRRDQYEMADEPESMSQRLGRAKLRYGAALVCLRLVTRSGSQYER